jgi:hypothetical protein
MEDRQQSMSHRCKAKICHGPSYSAIGKQVNSRFDCRSSGYTVASGNDWTTRFQAIVLAVCVGFVFGIAAASRNPRFQAARYGLTRAELAPADRASFGWCFPLFHPITLDVCRQAQLRGHGLVYHGVAKSVWSGDSNLNQSTMSCT